MARNAKLKLRILALSGLGLLLVGGNHFFKIGRFEKMTLMVQVAHVWDGDTFMDVNGQNYRIHAVNAPELSANSARLRQLANAAKTYLSALISGQTLRFQIETSDQYQRIVGRTSYRGHDLAALLLQAGYAKVSYVSLDPRSRFYSDDYQYLARLLNYQHQAFLAQKGVWKKP